ncbi:ester cyclase [Shimia abyssi]|uniref:SnoaL-like polyketide cyclase n=1 Tax=Shimia abyssi TaxID=1662395 RepID=A0A2P8F6C8_9RHOB|nr:nuclear transport factor 2 family protein [Shimia abyssi]PSL17274.1 SnoaL-like polyketide cyclase [Shimia abyssi]
MDKRELLQQWYQRVWLEVDLDAIDELFTPDTEAKGLLPDFAAGPDDFRDLVPMFLELIEEPTFSLDKVMEEGDWAAALYSLSATNPANGQQVFGSAQLFARFAGGKMVETYNSIDFMSFFEQMGLLPEQSMYLCLTGQKIRG